VLTLWLPGDLLNAIGGAWRALASYLACMILHLVWNQRLSTCIVPEASRSRSASRLCKHASRSFLGH